MCLGTYGGAPFWLVGILWLYWIQILAYLLFGRIQSSKTGDQPYFSLKVPKRVMPDVRGELIEAKVRFVQLMESEKFNHKTFHKCLEPIR